ncbi:tetratricopeptide repeat protein [uncultured Aquimarina sp.]|uniref:tetratricopeptide repeat protein n=1 Tax=uncultured Aquimarina sp. TaxID=575652 RepID=UPI0026327452|nr:tetratricopeptide repeat protein [uncultured Aquimarina sp.]
MNKLTGFLLALLLFNSCKNNGQESSSSKMESNTKIEFTDSLGNKISKDELAKSTGSFNYEVFGIGNVPKSAKLLHNQARQHGQKGDYKKAIETLNLACKEAPDWVYPVYDLAYTYLLKDDYDNALKYYRLTDSLAPKGFYTSKTALHTLEKEKKGDLKQGLYKMYISLEWINDPKEKLEMTELLVSKFPTFAPGWKEYSSLLEGEKRRNAIEKGLELESDIETKGMLLINKALMIDQEGDKKQSIELLTNVIFDSNSTYGNIELAKFVLNNIIKE